MIGPPSLPSCWIASFQPIRVLAKKIDSIARDDSFLIGCVPAGGVIPKIFATIKLPIRACSSAAPTAISRGKCFFSVPSSNGLPVCGFTTNWQIIACGTPKPTRILTLLRCSVVATKDFRPLRPGGRSINGTTRRIAAGTVIKPIGARAVGKVVNDDRADWREAWALFPGSVAYIWHAGTKAGIVQDSLAACGFETRSQIIWAKNNFAIGRGHYHCKHEPCWYVVRKGSTASWVLRRRG